MPLAETLAELAADAYSQNPAKGLPEGFVAIDLPGLQMHNGLYANGPAAAAVSFGFIEGAPVLVVAFRGSDDRTDWLDDLRDINAEYASFQPLLNVVETFAGAGGHVLLVGHSLGGAMAQIFMYEHAGDDHYRAVTFGSPGALPEAGVFGAEADSRITNYAISDDPLVFLGEQRAEVAAYALAHPDFAAALVHELASFTHLPAKEVAASVGFMTADYLNDGTTITLPGAGDPVTISNLLAADPAEHDPATYVALTGMSGVIDPVLW